MPAKKSFGQHFLKHPQLARRIAESLTLQGYEQVLEVGPGKGVLTRFLLQLPLRVVAVEADRDLVAYLHTHLPELPPERLIQGDFLKVDLEALLQGQPFALVGNFPYNISSQILIRMLEHRRSIPELVGMFQREVAQRVIAPPGSKTYGVLSVLVQAFYEGEYLFTVDKKQFTPPPKVQSGVIRLSRKPTQELGCSEGNFRRVVKTAFSQRRKMLRNTLKALVPAPYLEDPLFARRPETLAVQEFIELTRRIEAWKGGGE